MMIVQTLIWFSLLLVAKCSTQYECLPHPEKSMCILDFIYYHPGGELITFPTGYDHYRIKPRSDRVIGSNVTIFDDILYDAMHRPLRVEITHSHMRKLILPSELQLGNFVRNGLSSVIVTAGRTYQINYLNLVFNELDDIAFVSSLVNLEVLNLAKNYISTIPNSTFTPLTKLKYLYLQHNSFSSIPWTGLPQTLIHLDCYYGYVKSTDFTNVSLPSLEYLGLQYNFLRKINVTALVLVAPHLKEAHLLNEYMTEDEKDQIKVQLTSNNINFIDLKRVNPCYEAQYENKDGICVRRKPGIVKAVLLSGVIVGMAAIGVYLAVLIFRHMNRKSTRDS